jgi:hypothetical protein
MKNLHAYFLVPFRAKDLLPAFDQIARIEIDSALPQGDPLEAEPHAYERETYLNNGYNVHSVRDQLSGFQTGPYADELRTLLESLFYVVPISVDDIELRAKSVHRGEIVNRGGVSSKSEPSTWRKVLLRVLVVLHTKLKP